MMSEMMSSSDKETVNPIFGAHFWPGGALGRLA